MAVFRLSQWKDEPFHEYFSRLVAYVICLESRGACFTLSELGYVILECINAETRIQFDALTNALQPELVWSQDGDMYWKIFKDMAKIDRWGGEEDDECSNVVLNVDSPPSLMNEPNIVDGLNNDVLNDDLKKSNCQEEGFIVAHPPKEEPYILSFENTPIPLCPFIPFPCHDNFAKAVGKLKRFFSVDFLSFTSPCYLCFCQVSSQAFDRLLRALTASDFG